MTLQSIQQNLPKVVYRTEKFRMKPSHNLYTLVDELCFKSKNLYNLALYNQRQCYFKHNKFLSYTNLYYLLKDTDACKSIPSMFSQQILRQVSSICISFTKAMQEYKNHPEKFLGRPKLPKYKPKNGRNIFIFNYTTSRIKDSAVHFHKILPNFTIPTRLSELNQVTIVPKSNGDYYFHITGTKEIPNNQHPNLKYTAGIDLGIDNFAAISVWNNTTQPLIINGKGLKSYNKNFNKRLSHYQSLAMQRNNQHTTHHIQNLYESRNRFLDTWMHQASNLILNYPLENEVKTLVIGHNKAWKQNSQLSKQTNQTFIQIPYNDFIHKLTYKAQDHNITVFIVEESYTSGTSFLDNEQPTASFYNKTRRHHRGLFISNNGTKINADINASYQIVKKVFPNYQLQHGILTPKQLHNKLTPKRLNVA